MSLAEELQRLEEMRQRGALTDEEVRLAKGRLLHPAPASDIPAVQAVSRLRRSRVDRWIGGVCGGVAAATGIESWIWRLVLAALALFGGTGVLIYVLLWIFVPEED